MPNAKHNTGASGSENRGFASMNKEEVKKIASKGGQSSHKTGSQGTTSNSRSTTTNKSSHNAS